jgi:hypothetical protein
MSKAWQFIAFAGLAIVFFCSCSDNKTTAPEQPKISTVTTAAVSLIAQTTAESGGNITSDGGAAVTARGICWSTNVTPTIADSKTTDGTGTGSFTSSLTGLTAGTLYYVRAYATNSAGTGYGNAQSFTTAFPSQEMILSSFDTGAEDWSVSGGGLYYRGTGGNSGGFIEFEDFEDQCGTFAVPNKFLGDLTVYAQGMLSFDLKNTSDNGGTMLGCYGSIRITSGSLYAETNVVPYDTFFSDWTSFSIPMTADTWGVTTEQWDSILANVTEIIIFMDAQMAYYDRIGLDNFRVTSPYLNVGENSPGMLSRFAGLSRVYRDTSTQ